MKIQTVIIDRDGTPVTINKSDFIEDEHELWDVDKVKPNNGEDSEPDPVEAHAVHRGGGKWIVEVDGKPIHEGYLTKEKATALVATHAAANSDD